ncbi:MAG: tetratricopeptide repeat protein [Nitrososphaeraceae archaeon]
MNVLSEKINDYLLRPNSCNYFQKFVILSTMIFIISGLNLIGDNDYVFAQVNASLPPPSPSNNSQQTQESLGSTNRDAILSYEQGNKFLNAKNYDQALISYKNAITFDPNWAAPLIKQGNTYFELANYTTAIESYDKGFAILGNLDENVKSIDKNNGSKPYWLDIWFDKGEALTNLKKFDDAIALYDKLISLDPNWANPWNSIGWALQKQGKNDEAVTAFDKATKLKPTWAKPWNSKGWALYKIGKFDEALFSFDKAIALEPKWDKPWFNKGKIFYDLDKYPDAKQFVEHALSLKADPKSSALLESINTKIQQSSTTTIQ